MKIRRTVVDIETPWAIPPEKILELINKALKEASILSQQQVLVSLKSNNTSIGR